MKAIKTKSGELVYVDYQDFLILRKYKWHCVTQNNIKYAMNSKLGKMHRFILGVTDPEQAIDHKDGNGLNNLRSNLRLCTHKENMRNKKRPIHNTSGYKGVYKYGGKYMVRCKGDEYITVCGFTNIIDAVLKYNELAIKLHGEFARINELTYEHKLELYKRGILKDIPLPDVDKCQSNH